MKDLSARQQCILEYIRDFLSGRGYPPSIRDIQAGCNISSTSVVDYNLKQMESRGYLHRHRDVSRGIELTAQSGLLPREVAVPLIGHIAAGQPLPVPTSESWDYEGGGETMPVPREMLRGRDNVYALQVRGQSMVDAYIDDGDVVLMQAASVVENGEMAAVWFRHEREATLKKVYLEGDKLRLQPANRQMQPFFVRPDDVEIQGRVIGVIRRLA